MGLRAGPAQDVVGNETPMSRAGSTRRISARRLQASAPEHQPRGARKSGHGKQAVAKSLREAPWGGSPSARRAHCGNA